MRISDWSSDVCSSDLVTSAHRPPSSVRSTTRSPGSASMSPRFLSTWPGWATGSPGRNADRLLPETTEGGIHEKDGMDTEWHADGTCGRRVDIDCGHGFGSRQGPGGGVRTALAGRDRKRVV